jgi:predicted lipid-binding transport protein (Tim44 family)
MALVLRPNRLDFDVTATIVILALIAAFLGLRLYSVLGKHGGDQEPVLPRAEERPRAAPVANQPAPVIDAPRGSAPTASDAMVYEPSAEIGIRAILAADRSFDVGRFLNGSQAAYRMILEAYWKGDRDTLRGLCDDDSYDAFDTAITDRKARGETLDNRLVTIDRATIVAASLAHGLARITVRFDADIAAITRDGDGRIVAGSMTDAVATQDVWSFTRPIDSRDPNWLLDETDAD